MREVDSACVAAELERYTAGEAYRLELGCTVPMRSSHVFGLPARGEYGLATRSTREPTRTIDTQYPVGGRGSG